MLGFARVWMLDSGASLALSLWLVRLADSCRVVCVAVVVVVVCWRSPRRRVLCYVCSNKETWRVELCRILDDQKDPAQGV